MLEYYLFSHETKLQAFFEKELIVLQTILYRI